MGNREAVGKTAPAYRVAPTWAGLRGPLNWSFAVGAVLLLVTGILAIRMGRATNANDGFVAFQPDVSLFPASPVAEANTLVGVAPFNSWPTSTEGWACPYEIAKFGDGYKPNRSWNSVRYDWSVDGTARSWIIGERTVSWPDNAEFDADLEQFRDAIEHCGWQYHTYRGEGFNSRPIELDGLPSGSFAFAIDASPDIGQSDLIDFGDSDPSDFHALGAVLPGQRRGEAMFVTWVAWGAEVPADSFVTTANKLFDAANDAPPSRAEVGNIGGDETEAFTPFSASRAGVTSILDGEVIAEPGRREAATQFYVPQCPRADLPDQFNWAAGHWDYKNATSSVVEVTSEARNALFATARWPERSEYLDSAKSLSAAAELFCFDTKQDATVIVEPVDVPGLPDGTRAARWNLDHDVLVALVTDDAQQLMMVVAWEETSGPVPTDDFAEVVRLAWADVVATNAANS